MADRQIGLALSDRANAPLHASLAASHALLACAGRQVHQDAIREREKEAQ